MERLKLIPYPSSVELFEGNVDCKEVDLVGEACFASDFFKDYAQKNSLTLSENGVKIQYSIDSALAIDEEGYLLEISQDGIRINANSKKGLNYAFCSLVHLFSNYNGVLPYCKIQDEPYLKFRGMLLDVGRYFFPVEEVLKYVDFCFLNKLNVLHWHLTEDQGWRIEIDKYPLLTQKGSRRSHTNFGIKPHSGFYTKEQIRQVIAYANERNVEVMPEIDLPGHAQAALACYPYLGCFDRKLPVATHWGVKHDPLCAGKESTYEWVFNMLDEVIELFGSNTKYIHIGGDEVFRHRWSLCEHCQATIAKYGLKDEEELQAHFMRRVCEFVVSKGCIPMAWNGVDVDKTVHEKVVWQFWSDERGGSERLVQSLAHQSGGYLNSNSKYNYVDFPYGMTSLKQSYEMTPLPEGMDRDKLVGAELTLWTEYIPNFKKACRYLLPRTPALSEAMWNNKEKDYQEFEQRLVPTLELFNKQGFRSASLKWANPSKLLGKCQTAWFNRRVLHWQGLHNLIDDAYVTRKYGKKRK
ncbi:MAG: beta-N-acetylhexosaminidase [Clostridia bacterium]|nr:beta-N-acetylhexosaminidase [Clostridia bacterium]